VVFTEACGAISGIEEKLLNIGDNSPKFRWKCGFFSKPAFPYKLQETQHEAEKW
jgi:hypothetical protein